MITRWMPMLLALLLASPRGDLIAQVQRRQQPLAGERARPRQQLETRLRQRLWQITKNRVGLTDEQMARLVQTTRPFEGRRRELVVREREARVALRRELQAGQGADQQRVAASLDRVLDAQRRRAELLIEEQRALGAFMSPVQRARYAALQEQLRRRAEMLRGQRAGAPPDAALDSMR